MTKLPALLTQRPRTVESEEAERLYDALCYARRLIAEPHLIPHNDLSRIDAAISHYRLWRQPKSER